MHKKLLTIFCLDGGSSFIHFPMCDYFNVHANYVHERRVKIQVNHIYAQKRVSFLDQAVSMWVEAM